MGFDKIRFNYLIMDNKLSYRVIFDIIIFLCIFHGWWFVVLPLAIFGLWRYPYFVEIIFAGIIYDSLFGFQSDMILWGYLGIIVSIVVFGAVLLLKKIVRR